MHKRFRLGHVEVTNICNFKCTFCADSQIQRKRSIIDPDLFYKVIDEIAAEQLVEFIALHVFGEPFLHKNISEFIQYVKKKGLKLNITTNASLLEDKHIDLLCSLLGNDDCVHVSLRSTNDALFSIHKSRETFDDYLRRIENLLKTKINKKSPFRLRLDVFWKTVFNVPLLLRQRDMMKYVLEKKSSQKLIKWTEEIVGEKPQYDKTVYSITGSRRLINFKNDIVLHFEPFTEVIDNSFNNRIKAITGYCDMRYFTVFCNGTVGPCCNNYDAKISFGNVKDKSLKEILFDADTIAFRKEMSSGKLPHEFCKLCRGHTNVFSWSIKQTMNFIRSKLDPYENRKMYFE